MIVSRMFIQAAVAENIITPDDMVFLFNYNTEDATQEDDDRMQSLCQRLVLWATPPYYKEEW